ncbi:Odorant receptor Or20, partial [Rhyzopertha dominica]
LPRYTILKLKKCTKHLQHMLRVYEAIEDTFNGQTFFQSFVSLGTICAGLLMLSLGLDQNFSSYVVYFIIMGLQTYLYCWFGHEVTEACAGIPYSLFEEQWIEAPATFKKQMLLTMIRMGRPVQLTMMKFNPLTLRTFLQITRVAYSFYACIRQVNKKRA